MVEDTVRGATRRLFWAAAWLAIVLVATKSYYLGVPKPFSVGEIVRNARSLAAISYADVLFVAALWTAARVVIAVMGRRPLATRMFSLAFAGASALCCLYAVANVLIFAVFGGFLTYPLLALVGDVRMVRSSVGQHLTPVAVCGLLGVPLAYTTALAMTLRLAPARRGVWVRRTAASALVFVWTLTGYWAYGETWRSRPDRRIAANSQWVFAASWWHAVSGNGVVRMSDPFPAGDLADFEPGVRSAPVPAAIRRAAAALNARVAAARRPPNVILIVLESVAARWTGLNGGPYDTTPTLKREAAAVPTRSWRCSCRRIRSWIFAKSPSNIPIYLGPPWPPSSAIAGIARPS
jgi:hypothetical protein